jgi:apolipoprotein N-acyltransferase
LCLRAASDRYGRVAAQSNSNTLPGATLIAEAPLGPGEPTIYARFGDVFGWTCVALSILVWLMPARKRHTHGLSL